MAGSWLVYVDANDNCYHRIDLNGNQRKKLSNETAGYFRNANSKWLYYRKSSNGMETLFWLSINGGSPAQIAKSVEWTVRLDGDWLYYFEKDQDPINSMNFKGRLVRVWAGGNDNKVFVMNDEPNYNSGGSIDVAGEWIYYSKGIAFAEITPHLYRVRKDGTQAEQVK